MFRTLFLTFCLLLSPVAHAQTYDIVINNGRVVDPETGLDAVRNVGVQGSQIAAISEFSLSGTTVIDATGSHPRSAGAFAKVLRSYVRERGLLSLSEAIRKISLMPAEMLEEFVPQMQRKGRLQVGMDADIVVFDLATITDNATYANSNQPATGVQTLLVNGGFAVRDGAIVLDADTGRAIRR